jgi:hypothetical protein
VNHWSKIKARSEIAIALLLSCAAAGLWIWHPVFGRTRASTSVALSGTPPSTGMGIRAAPPRHKKKGRIVRRVYGHSLVAGGIHSIEELMAVIARDPRLAEHYENFDLSKARIVTLDHNVVAYVSYRLAKGIYWEARPSIIAKGEQVITDGTNFIRVRCGNRISYAPGPTSPGEPKDVDIVVALIPAEPPPVGPIPAIEGPALPAPPLLGHGPTPPGGPWPPIVPVCCVGGGPRPIPQPWYPPHVSADEFPTISLPILGHAYKLPSEDLALLVGVLLVVALHFVFWT